MRSRVILHFLRSGLDEDGDDVIKVIPTSSPELFRVVYRPVDVSREYSTLMSRGSVMTYVTDILKSLKYDIEPFDRVQLLTCLHPSVMYSVADLDSGLVRRNIEDIIYTALRAQVV